MTISPEIQEKIQGISQKVHREIAEKDGTSFGIKMSSLEIIGLDPATSIPTEIEDGMASLIELNRGDEIVTEYLTRCATNNFTDITPEMESWIDITYSESRDQLYKSPWNV